MLWLFFSTVTALALAGDIYGTRRPGGRTAERGGGWPKKARAAVQRAAAASSSSKQQAAAAAAASHQPSPQPLHGSPEKHEQQRDSSLG
mmetsp:Transcript_7106/g.13977  ORF Transcript_7106/g.13977 Transcript_7106/m.13977 type:complete len:89 (-) Transcript_7106:1136-1402(-)